MPVISIYPYASQVYTHNKLRILADNSGSSVYTDLAISSTGTLTISSSSGTANVTISAGDLKTSAGSISAGTAGTTVAERRVSAGSGAGEIYMFSQSATNGSRGIYLPAHGSGDATSLISVNANNAITYHSGTVNGALTVSNGLTVSASGLNITAGGATITAGNVVATAGYIIAQNNHLYAGTTSNTAERNVYARSGAGEIRLFSAGTTTGARGIAAAAHGTGSAITIMSVDTNNVPYVAATMRASSANNNASRLRNITCQNSAGTATSTNYLITRRLS